MKWRIFKHKKGVNDISIIAVILFIFLLTATLIPFVNAEFNQSIDVLDVDKIAGDVQAKSEEVASSSGTTITSLSAFGVLKTVIKLAFFDFSNTLGLPFWLDILYTGLAIIFFLVIARNIWIGGGA